MLIGIQCSHGSQTVERHDHQRKAVVDNRNRRKLGSNLAARNAKGRRHVGGILSVDELAHEFGTGLPHRGAPREIRFDLDRNVDDTDTGLESNDRRCTRDQALDRGDEAGANHRVTGKRKLDLRREDPQPKVRIRCLRRQDERGFREVHLVGRALHLLIRQSPRVGEDCELIAGERRLGKDVGDDEGKIVHGDQLSGVQGTFQREGHSL